MRIRNVSVTGIFVDNGGGLISDAAYYEVGDYLIFNGTLYKAKGQTKGNPSQDPANWSLVEAELATVYDLINNDSSLNSKLVTTAVLRGALYGPDGIANFLSGNTGDNYIRSWGRNLSDIDRTSTYIVTANAVNIDDLPPMVALTNDKIAIVNTIINRDEAGNNVWSQELLTIDDTNNLSTFSVRANYGTTYYGEWRTVIFNATTEELNEKVITLIDMYRKLSRYHEVYLHKYTEMKLTSSTDVDLTSDNADPYINYKIEVQYTKNGETYLAWFTVFNSDIEDSVTTTFVMSDTETSARIMLANRHVKTVNDCSIKRILKFTGNGDGNPVGSDWFDFNYSEG